MKVFDVERHGPAWGTRVGDGDGDVDTPALVDAVAAASAEPNGAILVFPRPVVYWTELPLIPTAGITWRGFRGPTVPRLVMREGAPAPHLMEAVNCPGMAFEDLYLDRGGSLAPPTPYVLGAVRLTRCDDARAERLIVSGARGLDGIASGVGFATAECDRVTIRDSLARDCIIADGFYVGVGDDCLLERVWGENVQDTIAVLEATNRSTIRGVRGLQYGALAAITNFVNASKRGNVMEDVKGRGGRAYSGGIRVGCVGAADVVGDLVDTTIRDIAVREHAMGPGLWAVETPASRIDGLTLDGITTSDTALQGLVLHAHRVRGRNIRVTRPGASGVQVLAGSGDVDLRCEVESAVNYPVYVQDARDVQIRARVTGLGSAVGYAVFFDGACPNARVAVEQTGCLAAQGSAVATSLGPVGDV